MRAIRSLFHFLHVLFPNVGKALNDDDLKERIKIFPFFFKCENAVNPQVNPDFGKVNFFLNHARANYFRGPLFATLFDPQTAIITCIYVLEPREWVLIAGDPKIEPRLICLSLNASRLRISMER